ncbi:TPA: hypothetical protein ACN7EE_004545 [Klebsiella pneumoniae]
MMNQQLSQLRELESALSDATETLTAFGATETALRDHATQHYIQNPSEVTGFTNQTTPISESGKRYAEGIAKGWVLEAIKPSQFALTFFWRTADLTDKQINAAVKKLVERDVASKRKPLAQAVTMAQANLDQFKENLRQLVSSIS